VAEANLVSPLKFGRRAISVFELAVTIELYGSATDRRRNQLGVEVVNALVAARRVFRIAG
jgi:hypothetical protein